MGNRQQANEILRFHRHLQRLGRAKSLEESARLWISRYARLWRTRHCKTPTVAAA